MKSIISLIFFFCLVLNLNAQVLGDTTQLPSENVEVVKNFKTQIEEAEMIPIAHPVIPEAAKQPEFRFDYIINQAAPLEVSVPEPTIRALAFTERKEHTVNNGFLKAGYGNLKSADVLGQYHFYIEDWLEAGIKGKFYNAQNTGDNPVQRMRDTGVGIYAAYFLGPQTKVKASLDSEFMRDHFYGGLPTIPDSVDLKNYRRNANDYTLGLSIHHTPFQKSKLILNTDLIADRFEIDDIFSIEGRESRDLRIGVKNHWGKRFGSTCSLGFYLDSQVDVWQIVDRLQTLDHTRFILRPHIIKSSNQYSALLGLHYDNSSLIWPMMDFKYKINSIGLTANLVSDIETNMINNEYLYRRNNHWNAFEWNLNDPKIHSVKKIGLGGFGEVSKLNYRLDFNYLIHKNLPVYQNATGFTTIFSHYLLDEENITAYQIKLNLDYPLLDWFTAEFGLDRTFYSDSEIQYIPDFMIDFKLSQMLLNKRISLYQALRYEAGRNSFDGPDLKNWTDISLGLDIILTKKIKIYGELNNILNQKYQIYEDYDRFGTNFHGGLKLIF